MWDEKALTFGAEKSRDNRELIDPCVIALTFFILRYILEKYVFTSIGTWLGVNDTKRKPAPSNPKLEKSFSVRKKWKFEEIRSVAKEVAMSEDEVRKWLRLKLAEASPTELMKFGDCLYNFLLTSGIAISTFVVLWDKPWFSDVDECWRDFYNQGTTNDVWWYYKIYFGIMFSELCSLSFRVRRKDFYLYVIHHVVLLITLLLSWKSNGLRYMSLYLIAHDCSDPFVEGAKLLKYLRCDKIANVAFIIFTLTWTVGRLVIVPFYLIKNFVVDVPEMLPNFTGYSVYYIFIGIFCTFLMINILWTFFIFKIVYQFCVTGEVEDSRSDDED